MFKLKLLETALLATVTIIITANPLKAQSYNQVIVFSDSLSDTGNLYNALLQDGQFPFPPTPPYFSGRFSNGLVWTENLSLSLGITPNSNDNYSFGGSQTGTSNLFEFNSLNPPISVSIPVPGLLGQINNYFTNGNIPNNDDLFLIWIGANDYLSGNLSSPETLITQTITNINQAIFTLNNLGAKNIGVANLPDLGNTPRVINLNNPVIGNALTNLTIAHNQALDSSLNNLELALGASLNLEIIDMSALFGDITANPANFGLTNVTNGCLLTPSCDNSNVAQFFFWDDIHPTARGHEIIADFALQSIPNNSTSTPEPSNAIALTILGLMGLGFKLRLPF